MNPDGVRPWLYLCALLTLPASAQDKAVADVTEDLEATRYVVGAVVANGPIYFGQQERASGFRPLFALRWGKVRISNSGAGALIGQSSAGGASADLFSSEAWRLRLGLRLDRGRRIKDDPDQRLEDLSRVRGTLRAGLTVFHSLPGQSLLSLALAPDLLGRGGGATLQLGLYKRLPTPEALLPLGGQWSLGAGLVAGDARYMRSYFGIEPGAKRFPAYVPEGGLRNASAGLGWQRAFGEKQQWVLFGAAQVQLLLGPAAAAPFIERKASWTADLGLAYRH